MSFNEIVRTVPIAALHCATFVMPKLGTVMKYSVVGFVGLSTLMGVAAATDAVIRNPRRLDEAVETGCIYGLIPSYIVLTGLKKYLNACDKIFHAKDSKRLQ